MPEYTAVFNRAWPDADWQSLSPCETLAGAKTALELLLDMHYRGDWDKLPDAPLYICKGTAGDSFHCMGYITEEFSQMERDERRMKSLPPLIRRLQAEYDRLHNEHIERQQKANEQP